MCRNWRESRVGCVNIYGKSGPGRWKRKCRDPVAILAPQEGWRAKHSVSEREGTRNDCRVTGRDQTT